MPSDLSAKIKAINEGKPVANPYHPEPPKPEKKVEVVKEDKNPKEILEAFEEQCPKIIKNDWQQPAMFWAEFILRLTIEVLAIATLWYVVRLICSF